jgi:methionine-rich copper-binding protein CopC
MRRLLVSLCLVGLTFFSTPQATAHVEIIATFPEQSASVNPIPTEVWIEFSGDLQNLNGEIVNTIEVTDSTGLVVSYDNAVIEAGRITTKVSGQSAAGVFVVKYRVVGQDGHVIEGDYTFNASPEFAEAVPTTAVLEKDSELPVGGILLGGLLAIFLAGIILKAKNRSS